MPFKHRALEILRDVRAFLVVNGMFSFPFLLAIWMACFCYWLQVTWGMVSAANYAHLLASLQEGSIVLIGLYTALTAGSNFAFAMCCVMAGVLRQPALVRCYRIRSNVCFG